MNPPQTGAPAPGATGSGQATPKTPANPNSTQNSLLISEIRDNLVIMKDGIVYKNTLR